MTHFLISVFVPGIPRPAGSKRAFPIQRKGGGIGVAVTDSSGQKGKEWRATIAGIVGPLRDGRPLIDEAIKASMIFFLPRPQAHYRSNGELKPSAPRFHTGKPDVLKLARAVEDALTSVVYTDDALITEINYSKVYVESAADPVGVNILITPSDTAAARAAFGFPQRMESPA